MNIEISPKEYERTLDWYDATLYCQLLVIDGKNDWRLPTKEELDYVYNSKNDFDENCYWTSSEHDNNGILTRAAFQDFLNGIQFDFGYKDSLAIVRAIRTI